MLLWSSEQGVQLAVWWVLVWLRHMVCVLEAEELTYVMLAILLNGRVKEVSHMESLSSVSLTNTAGWQAADGALPSSITETGIILRGRGALEL